MTTENSQKNPVRFTLAHLEETVGHLKDHAKHCDVCERPGKKMREAFNTALDDAGTTLMTGLASLTADLIMTFRDPAFSDEARTMKTNALATQAMLAVNLAAKITARVHDEKPNLMPFDMIRDLLTPMADLFDAEKARRH